MYEYKNKNNKNKGKVSFYRRMSNNVEEMMKLDN